MGRDRVVRTVRYFGEELFCVKRRPFVWRTTGCRLRAPGGGEGGGSHRTQKPRGCTKKVKLLRRSRLIILHHQHERRRSLRPSRTAARRLLPKVTSCLTSCLGDATLCGHHTHVHRRKRLSPLKGRGALERGVRACEAFRTGSRPPRSPGWRRRPQCVQATCPQAAM